MSPDDKKWGIIDPKHELSEHSVVNQTAPESYQEKFTDGVELKFNGVKQAGETAVSHNIQVEQVSTTEKIDVATQAPEPKGPENTAA